MVLDRICDSINSIDTDNVILLGDFNFREIDWDTNEGHSPLSRKFLSCLEENMLFQLVKEPTRGPNIFDLILTGNPDIVHSVVVDEKLGRSDHRIVIAELRIPVLRITDADRKIYLYSKGEYDSTSVAVKETDWNKEFA